MLCPLRGGAFKELANPNNSSPEERYWVHLGCALGVGLKHCHFVDVRRRTPLLLATDIEPARNRLQTTARRRTEPIQEVPIPPE